MSDLGAGMPVAEYVKYDALGLAELVRRREVQPRELLAAATKRADAVNPAINAIAKRHDDLAEAQIAAGLPDGPFTGVPFLVKDLFVDWGGTVTANGSVLFPDAVAPRDSTVLTRYKAAGLVVFGKTSTPEFGNALETSNMLTGQARNPWDLSLSPGGSSGGSAAAVAAGIVPAANASDAFGSIRIPAACCGLFGLKPSRARVSLGPGRYEGGGGVATLHALTRSVRDSAALLDATQGPELGAPYPSWLRENFLAQLEQAPGRLRIALMREGWNGTMPAAPCLEALDDAAALCAQLGHEVEEARPPVDAELLALTENALRGAGLVRLVRMFETRLGRPLHDSELEPVTWELYRQGLSVTADAVLAARDAMFTLHRQVAQFLETRDIVLSPTIAHLPAPVGTYSLAAPFERYKRALTEFSPYVGLYNLTGQPSMSIPLHRTAADLPAGVLFTGRIGDEALLLRLARQIEQARPWSRVALPV